MDVRVPDARVNVAKLLKFEETCGVLGALERVRSLAIQGHPTARRGVRKIAAVSANGFKAFHNIVIFRHAVWCVRSKNASYKTRNLGGCELKRARNQWTPGI